MHIFEGCAARHTARCSVAVVDCMSECVVLGEGLLPGAARCVHMLKEAFGLGLPSTIGAVTRCWCCNNGPAAD
jgi:hypothetical protein